MVIKLGDVLPEAARRFADGTALVVGEDRLSFAELDTLSNRVANGLVAVGVTPGDRVTLYGPNSWEWVVGYYAVAKTGAVVNPISSMLTPDEVRYVLADSGARVLIASADKGREARRDARQQPCESAGARMRCFLVINLGSSLFVQRLSAMTRSRTARLKIPCSITGGSRHCAATDQTSRPC